MKRLELIFYIGNISVLYRDGSVNWPNAEFTSLVDFSAELKIWDDEVEPEQILETWKKQKERCTSFLTAMKYMGNRKIVCTGGDFPTYFYGDKTYTPRNEAEIEILVQYLRGEIPSFMVGFATFPAIQGHGHITIPAAPLPLTMPLVPHCLRRIAATITLVEELVDFPDLQLKVAFMALEELITDKQVQDYKDIKNARNFVSHSSCVGPEVFALLRVSLPSAINPSKTNVKFDRENNEHQAFAATFASKARQWAKEEFENEVVRLGGGIP